MYQKFDLKKDKELILLNYYIATNLVDSKIDLTTMDVAELLEIRRTKAHRVLSKFQELGLIIPLKKSYAKNKKTTYLYIPNGTDEGTDNASKINVCTGMSEMDSGTDDKQVRCEITNISRYSLYRKLDEDKMLNN